MEKIGFGDTPFFKTSGYGGIEAEIRYWFPKMNNLIWSHSGKQIGFSACNENKLEMLFIEDDQIGKGYGKQILKKLINEFNIVKVDVNEKNEVAVKFYLKNGFQLSSRDELDNEGRAYPILHLELMK